MRLFSWNGYSKEVLDDLFGSRSLQYLCDGRNELIFVFGCGVGIAALWCTDVCVKGAARRSCHLKEQMQIGLLSAVSCCRPGSDRIKASRGSDRRTPY
jgi:hypothetical protein